MSDTVDQAATLSHRGGVHFLSRFVLAYCSYDYTKQTSQADLSIPNSLVKHSATLLLLHKDHSFIPIGSCIATYSFVILGD